MRKVVLPMDNNKLSADFEQCLEFIIYSIEDKCIIKRDRVSSHFESGLLPYWLASEGVTDIISRGININSINKFNQFKINVFVGVNLFDPEKLIEEYLNETLETNSAMVVNVSSHEETD